MKYYITKYALINGIEEVEGKLSSVCPDLLCYKIDGSQYEKFAHTEGRDFHVTKEAAIKKAEAMRIKKIASIKKQLAKLETMTFG